MTDRKNVLCVLPWIQTYVDMYGNVQICCVAREPGAPEIVPYGNIDSSSLSELFFSPYMNDIREKMMVGEWPACCNDCRKNEAMGIKSFRQIYNEKYPEVYQTLVTNAREVKPLIRVLDLRVSNRCNYRCRPCTIYHSSSWSEQFSKINPGDKKIADMCHQKVISIQNKKKFWEEFNDHIIDNLEEIHFAGGEPLLIEKHYQILERLIEKSKTGTKLSYNTNLSVLSYSRWNVVELWKHFNNVLVSFSLDGVEKSGEYIRSGLNWENWLKNVNTIKKEVPGVRRDMHFVVSIFNILNFKYHYDLIRKNDFVSGFIGFTFLKWPKYLSVQVLHPKLKKIAEKELNKILEDTNPFYDDIRDTVKSVIKYMYERDLYKDHGEEFIIKTMKLDKMRNENYLELFPELRPMREIMSGVK